MQKISWVSENNLVVIFVSMIFCLSRIGGADYFLEKLDNDNIVWECVKFFSIY